MRLSSFGFVFLFFAGFMATSQTSHAFSRSQTYYPPSHDYVGGDNASLESSNDQADSRLKELETMKGSDQYEHSKDQAAITSEIQALKDLKAKNNKGIAKNDLEAEKTRRLAAEAEALASKNQLAARAQQDAIDAAVAAALANQTTTSVNDSTTSSVAKDSSAPPVAAKLSPDLANARSSAKISAESPVRAPASEAAPAAPAI